MANTKKRKVNSVPKLPTVEIAPSDFSPLIFISHDNRDADIAEAFSKLLSSVSAGVLKSFRSSDKSGTQGIEYGAEWFPKLMEKLQRATDVVCILSEYSVDRPWILFEAGVARGKLSETPILGLAIGILLRKANSGPFAQFQNCDDTTESITKLVTQLVKRIPSSEPDSVVIKSQVEIFKERVDAIIKERGKPKKVTEEKAITSDESAAKTFEEIKVMFNNLAGSLSLLSNRVDKIYGEVGIVTRRLHSPFGGIERHAPEKSITPFSSVISDDLVRDVNDYLYGALPKGAQIGPLRVRLFSDSDPRRTIEIRNTGDLTREGLDNIAKELMNRFEVFPKFID